MKKDLLIIIGCVVLIGLALFLVSKYLGSNEDKKVASYTVSNPDAPKIEIPEKIHDFGKINLTDVAKYPFKVKNGGKSPLVITSITTSCHCTTAVMKIPGKSDSPAFAMHSMDAWQGEIASGEGAVLEVIYEPAKMPVKGPINRIIYLRTNDPNNPDPKFEINAEVL